MCMIAHRKATPTKRGSNMPNEVIETALARHSDGYGIAWREAGELIYEKFGPKERSTFRALLKQIDHDQRKEYVAHFRFATQGPACKDLAHPYEYQDPDPKVGRVLVFHNGIIDIAATKIESDTQVFVRDVMAKMPSRWWDQTVFRSLVDMAIGWSKLVLMTADETVNLQEYSGTKDGGIWYSSNHKGYVPTATVGTVVGTTYSGSGWAGSWDAEAESYGDWSGRLPTAPGSAIVPYTGGESAKSTAIRTWTRPIDADPKKWYQGGHPLTTMQAIDRTVDGDYPQSVMCDLCNTIGDVYIIDKTAYIDMGHQYGESAAEYERAEPEEMEGATIA